MAAEKALHQSGLAFEAIMKQLFAKSQILDIVYAMAHGQDTLNRAQILSCFHPTRAFTFDVSAHLASYSAMEITPTELFEKTYLALSGFTATQHVSSNPIVTFQSDTKAHVKAMALAYHCIETDGHVESVTARGWWDMDLEMWEGKWIISGIVITRDVPLDNPKLYAIAKERAEKGLGRKETASS